MPRLIVVRQARRSAGLPIDRLVIISISFFGSMSKKFSALDICAKIATISTFCIVYLASYLSLINFWVGAAIVVVASAVFFVLFLHRRRSNSDEKFFLSKYDPYYCALDYIKSSRGKNQHVHIRQYVKNIVHSDDNNDIAATIILLGDVKRDNVSGVWLTVAGGSRVDNLSDIKYYMFGRADIVDMPSKSTCADILTGELAQQYEMSAKREMACFSAATFFLPFSKSLYKGDVFQIIFCYKWSNSHRSSDSSTSYMLDEFPSGVDRLMSCLTFTNRPYAIKLSRVEVKFKGLEVVARWEDAVIKDRVFEKFVGGKHLVCLDIDKPECNFVLHWSVNA